MKLYLEQDLRDYHYLSSKYAEITDKMVKQAEGKADIDVIGTIENKFYLKLLVMTKDMIDELGVEVPDDKAKELGLLEKD